MVNQRKFFSVIADETTNKTNSEKLKILRRSLSIAVVDYKKAIKTETTSVKERESDIDEIHLTGIK